MKPTFADAVNRSMAEAPPGTTQAQWLEGTPKGRLVAAAKAMGDDDLMQWLLMAPCRPPMPAPAQN